MESSRVKKSNGGMKYSHVDQVEPWQNVVEPW